MGWSSDVSLYSHILLWKLDDGKTTQFHILFSKKQSTKFHPVFLPTTHLPTRIKNSKPSLNFLKNSMKKFPQEPLKTNTSTELHSFSRGKEKLGDAPIFSFPQHLGRTMKRTPTDPRLHQTSAVHHPPVDWKQCPHGSQGKAELHNKTLDLRWEFTDCRGQGEPLMRLRWVMTGLLVLFNPH